MGDYPIGAELDPRAPWNEPSEAPEHEVEVWVSTSLSRPAVISAQGVIEEEPDVEQDEEGNRTYIRNYDYSNCNFTKDFENQYYTIKEILTNLADVVNDIGLHGLTDSNLRKLNKLAREGELWEENELEVVRA